MVKVWDFDVTDYEIGSYIDGEGGHRVCVDDGYISSYRNCVEMPLELMNQLEVLGK